MLSLQCLVNFQVETSLCGIFNSASVDPHHLQDNMRQFNQYLNTFCSEQSSFQRMPFPILHMPSGDNVISRRRDFFHRNTVFGQLEKCFKTVLQTAMPVATYSPYWAILSDGKGRLSEKEARGISIP